MAQHDYVIDNSTGANVRADLNNALQAIVTNNSGSSAPSATFPFMLFADSSAGTMKIRNAADNAFIELFQLDGTFTLEDGSASTPALAFRDDLNTGIFQPGNNQLAVSCNGTQVVEFGTAEAVFNDTGADINFRIEGSGEDNLFMVDAGNDRIGIGTSIPDNLLHLFESSTTQTADASSQLVIEKNSNSGITILSGNVHNGRILFGDSGDNDIGQIDYDHNNNNLSFTVNANERMRIDSSGRMLIGTTTEGEVNADDLTIANSGQCGITIRSGTTNDGQIFFSDATSGSGEYSGFVQYNHTNNQLNFGESSQARATIRGGKFGVGTTDPAHLGHFVGAVTPEFVVHDTTNHVKAVLGADNDVARIGSDSNHPMTLRVNDTEKARIHTTGEFSLATTSKNLQGGGASDFYLSISANTGSNHNGMMINGIAAGHGGLTTKASTSSNMFPLFCLNNDNTNVGSVEAGFTGTSFNTTSDYRLKENITNISDGITRIKQLLPRRFNWISDETNTLQDGFLAHEVSAIVPEAVTGEKDAIATENGGQYQKDQPIYQQMDHSKLVPLLVAAVQELIGKVEALEAA